LKGDEMKSRKNLNLVVVCLVVCVGLVFVSGCSFGGSGSLNEIGILKCGPDGVKFGYAEQLDSGLAISNDPNLVNSVTKEVGKRAKDKQTTGLQSQKVAVKTNLIKKAIKEKIITTDEELINSMGF